MSNRPNGPHGAHQPGLRGINKEQRAVIGRLMKYVFANYRWTLVAVMVCIVVATATSLVSALFTRTLIDDYIVPLTQSSNPNFTPLAVTLCQLAAVLGIGTLCNYAYNRMMVNVSQGTMLKLRRDMFSHLETLPVSYFDQHPHGEVMSAFTNDVDSLRQMIGQALPSTFSSVLTIVMTFTSMVVMSVPLTIVSVVMVLVMMRTSVWLGQRSRTHFAVQQEKTAQVNSFIEEMMTGQKTVKVFAREQILEKDFGVLNAELRDSNSRANKIANIVMPINGNLSQLSYVLIAVVGAMVAINGWTALTLGTLVSFLTLNRSFTRPVSQLSMQVNNVLNASVGAERVFALLDTRVEPDVGKVGIECKGGKWNWVMPDGERREVQGDINMEGVDFGYVPGKTVLHDISLYIRPGQRVAFVGGTGAGKTTVINLLTRFYDIERGTITIDGVPLGDISKSALRQAIGVVLQETHLFTGTVMENIAYGKLGASRGECIQAAKLAGAHNFIRRLPQGYDTRLEADGASLSQGERQLLSIARAALNGAPILVLDEATSSIDTHTERLIQRGLAKLTQGRTTLSIAHRLSTVRHSHCIMVMEQGRIIERGPHDDLMALHGKYYQLCAGS